MSSPGDLTFDGEIIYWRGPAPHLFVRLPEAESAEIQDISGEVSYGWGCIAVRAAIGGTEFTTALMPKDGRYLLPVKVAVRRAEGIDEGDVVTVRMSIQAS
ncbi:DUF1905 domain-containing protein [Georgenia alba]|uniref:DUF1905 domain-containing protein n=1 Tax=Georgenia alba TaxID=2233858 RepID=A0ABW2Q3R9_9MICO